MKKETISCVLFILSFLKGALSQTSTISLESRPAYAVVGPGGNATGTLLCIAKYDEQNPPHRSWLSGKTLLTFNENVLKTRFSASLIEAGNAYNFALKLDPLRLTDENEYTCQISIDQKSLIETVDLHINQFPTTRLSTLRTEVMEGNTATVAECHADLSKPAPEIWFEDTYGNRIGETGTVVNVEECCNGLSNSSLHLRRNFRREDMDEKFYCKIRHINHTAPITLPVEQVKVKYPPTATLDGQGLFEKPVILEEGCYFSVLCNTDGYPKPTITWTFTPSKKTGNATSQSMQLPSNFVTTDDGRQILSQKLQIADDDGAETNNGTFTCSVSNGIGSDSVSFELQIYAMPTTTPAPTTPALTTVKDGDNIIPVNPNVPEITPAPVQAGPSAAVIAGIVAVAIFILIVTVILLLRYFMSHKGEYYTHELKTEDERNDLSEECSEPIEELLEEKRPEYFL